jgi:hypothetical protein
MAASLIPHLQPHVTDELMLLGRWHGWRLWAGMVPQMHVMWLMPGAYCPVCKQALGANVDLWNATYCGLLFGANFT